MQTEIPALEKAQRRWAFRGRPRGRFRSLAETRLLEYLAKVSVTHRIDSNEFLDKLAEAWEHRESKCKKLAIVCRRKTKKASVFLITTGHKVVAQLPIPTHLLEEARARTGKFEHVFENVKRSMTKGRKDYRPSCLRIKDLKAGMRNVNLNARILEIPKPKMVYTKLGTAAHVSNVLIVDETGSMRMSLWNQQINMISRGDLINIKKGKAISFGGELQLRIERGGQLSVIERTV